MCKRILQAGVLDFMALAIVAVLAGCAGTRFADLYQPGDAEVALWGSETIPVEPGWRYIGAEQFNVRGETRDTSLPPIDLIQTLVFVREGEGPASILLMSRVVKTGDQEVFVFLGGYKTELNGRTFRESLYGLPSETTDPEYRRYLARASAAGAELAPIYRVKVLDRLPVDTVMIRAMELTPGKITSSLPPYGKLYPQERLDPLFRDFR